VKPFRLIRGEKKEAVVREVPSFETLLAPVFDRLWSFIQKLSKDGVWAEDIFQETTLKAYRALHTLQDPSRFKPWIFQIAYREWVSSKRREAQVPFFDLPLDENMFIDHNPWDSFSFEAPQFSLGEEIEKELENIDQHLRQVILLKYMEGFDYQEIAHILGVSEGTVASRLFRAKALLKEKLWQIAKEKGWVKDS
jgi:RNA polymerase sigma-70 factor (ECF subfamily)